MIFSGKTVFISGASRGIGKAIALRLAKEGANIIIAAKSVKEDPRLGGTVYSAALEINEAGGRALPVPCDIRDEIQIIDAVQKGIAFFGGIDVLVNNASAINLSGTEATDTKRFDLMHDINVRGTFLLTKHCIPFLKRSTNPHIITLSPPVNLQPKWLAMSPAYTISKYNMTLLSMGWAEEFKGAGIAVNALWPVSTIATSAVKNLLGGEVLMERSRKPDILADAVYYILQQPAANYTGQCLLDEDVLKAQGISNFDAYAVNKDLPLQRDLFL
jgi:citronellol/citronellal dehydrogenase